MAIDTSNTYKPGGPGTGRATSGPASPTKTRSESPAATGNKAAAGDTVELSEQAQNMGRLQDKIAAVPEVDSERVAAIRQAISEGRFEINPEKLAEAILRQDELLG